MEYMKLHRLILPLALALTLVVSFGIPRTTYAFSCSAGEVQNTPQSNSSLFTNHPTAAYACTFAVPDTTGGGANTAITSYFDSSGAALTGEGSVSNALVGTQEVSNGKVIGNCGLLAFSFTDCIWIPLMSWLGSWFLTLGGAALVLSGVLFDWLVQYVIIQFGTTLTSMGAIGAINTGWSIFRDLSNIVIIGMFTFIAIMTILGSTDYGYKKMLSRVLIVAVLINFSLLFTKVIIDVGNFTAYQIYEAVAASPQFSSIAGSNNSGNSAYQFDIAGAFLRPMGISSVWNDTQGVLQNFGQTTNSGIQAFVLGLVGGLLLLLLAVVLFYGCFLIAARAVLLIVLMVTASIAFASYLVPKFSESEYGWSGWWKSLINATLFAPLLMTCLAITLLVMNGASQVTQGLVAAGSATQTTGANAGGIGGAVFQAISQPNQAASGNGWTVIMLYIFGVGLLFASLKLSSSFASSISGLNIGQALWGQVTGGALSAVGATSGFLRQQTVGRWAYGMQETREGQAKRARDEAAEYRRGEMIQTQLGNKSLSQFAAKQAKRLERIAGKNIQSAERYGKVASRKVAGVEGFSTNIKRRGEEAAKAGEKLAPSKENLDAARQEAEKSYSAQREEGKLTREAIKKSTEANAQQVGKMVDTERAAAEENARAVERGANQQKEAIKLNHDAIISELGKQVAQGGPNATGIERQRNERIARRKTELDAEDARIETAKQEAQNKIAALNERKFSITRADGTKVETTLNEVKSEFENATTELKNYVAESAKKQKEIGDAAVDGLRNSAEGSVREIAKRQGTILERAIGGLTGDNELVADGATKKYRGKRGRNARLLQDLKEEIKEEGGEKKEGEEK